MSSVSRTLRIKVSLGVGLTLLVLLAPFNFIQYQVQRQAALRELEFLAAATGSVVVKGLEQSMLANNRKAIQVTVDTLDENPDIRAIYLITPDGEVAVSPQRSLNGQVLDRKSDTCNTCHRLDAPQRPLSAVVATESGEAVFRTMTPILNKPACHECHDADQRLNGVFYMDLSMVGFNQRLDNTLRTAFLGSVTIIVLSSLILYVLLSWLFITPMEHLARTMRRFSQGQNDARADVTAQDEVGLLAGGFNRMADTIQLREHETTRLYGELAAQDTDRRRLLNSLITAREEEQQRVARRIHDVLGQLLTGLSVYLRLGQDAIPPEQVIARQHLETANKLVQETIGQAHEIITQLRPPVLDDYGLADALREEVKRQLTPLGITTHFTQAGNPEAVDDRVRTAAFRIAQEAVANIVRHAQADQVWIDLRCGVNGDGETPRDELCLIVEDNGVGLPSDHVRGMGILGMQERAGALAGTVIVENRDPQGTRLRLVLPIFPPISPSDPPNPNAATAKDRSHNG